MGNLTPFLLIRDSAQFGARRLTGDHGGWGNPTPLCDRAEAVEDPAHHRHRHAVADGAVAGPVRCRLAAVVDQGPIVSDEATVCRLDASSHRWWTRCAGFPPPRARPSVLFQDQVRRCADGEELDHSGGQLGVSEDEFDHPASWSGWCPLGASETRSIA